MVCEKGKNGSEIIIHGRGDYKIEPNVSKKRKN